jgi:hypothetical protein
MRRDEEGKGQERVWKVKGGGFVTRSKNAGADAGIRYQESDQRFSTSSSGLLGLLLFFRAGRPITWALTLSSDRCSAAPPPVTPTLPPFFPTLPDDALLRNQS